MYKPIKNNKLAKRYISLISLLILLFSNVLYAQAIKETQRLNKPLKTTSKAVIQTNKTAQNDISQQPFLDINKIVTIEEVILVEIKNQLPEDKYLALEKLNGKSFSNKELETLLNTLTEPKFTAEEIHMVLTTMNEYQQFVEKLKEIAPKILKNYQLKQKIELKHKKLSSKKTKTAAKKNQLAIEIQKLNSKKYIFTFDIGINEYHIEQIVNLLTTENYKPKEIEIIKRNIHQKINITKKILTLKNIISSVDKIRSEIYKKENEKKILESGEEKTKIYEELKKLSYRSKELKNNFTLVTTGIDIENVHKKDKKETDFNKEIEDIFSPLIHKMKEFTERPRKMESLRRKIDYYKKQLPKIRQGIKNINQFNHYISDNRIKNRLKESKNYWIAQEQEFTTKLELVEHQLFELKNEKVSLNENLNYFYETIIKKRGVNIILALLALVITYLILYSIKLTASKFNPFKDNPKFYLSLKFINVTFYLLSFFIALLAMLITLYITHEWLILAIIIAIILGIMWGAKNTLPQFIDEIKLLLDIGTVRCGEKVIYNGLAWRVESIGFYSYFKNPLLTGGEIRLPLKDLTGLRSRPYDEKEPWFPCKEGDVIIINDEPSSWAKVILQTPQVIKFNKPGLLKSMPVSEFLENKILNLSVIPFKIDLFFNIAYKHQAIIDEILNKLSTATEDEFQSSQWSASINKVIVRLVKYKERSLLIRLRVLVKPEAAFSYGPIKISLVKIILTAAQKYNWEIKESTSIHLNKKEMISA